MLIWDAVRCTWMRWRGTPTAWGALPHAQPVIGNCVAHGGWFGPGWFAPGWGSVVRPAILAGALGGVGAFGSPGGYAAIPAAIGVAAAPSPALDVPAPPLDLFPAGAEQWSYTSGTVALPPEAGTGTLGSGVIEMPPIRDYLPPVPTQPVPEPSGALVLGAGVLALVGARRRTNA